MFNFDKTCGMKFSTKYLKLDAEPCVFLGTKRIKFADKVKYLGVFLNNRLSDDDVTILRGK